MQENDGFLEEEEDEALEEELDALVECVREQMEDEESVSMLNPHEVQAMNFACRAIKKVLRESGCRAKVVCRQSEIAPDVGMVEVEAREIDIKSMEWFCRAAEFATTTEVYPLVNGKVRMVFGFNNLLTTIG